MKNPNKLLSYSFGVLAGLSGVFTSAKAQTSPAAQSVQAAPLKDVDFSKSFSSDLDHIFVKRPDQYFTTTNIAYYPDSTKLVDSLKKYQNIDFSTSVIITKRVSDQEQVVFFAKDKDHNRVIEQDEVTFMIDYKADKEIITERSALKLENGKYSIADRYAATKSLAHPIDYTEYSDLRDWKTSSGKLPNLSDDLLKPFKTRQAVKRPRN